MFLSNSLDFYASVADFSGNIIGSISQDRSAIIGKDDWCFIYEGANKYYGAYISKNNACLGENWAELIDARSTLCDSIGIAFLQVVVPNKATTLFDFFPFPLGEGITDIAERLLSASIKARLLFPIVQFRVPNIKYALFRRNDSHLTIAGNAYLADLMLSSLGISCSSIQLLHTHLVDHVGDLGSKFSPTLSERCHVPYWDRGLFDQSKITKILDVEVNGFNGTCQVFSNDNAPIQKRILVFGNSFFERVPSWGLSPFFVSLFKYFAFYWTSSFLIDEVVSHQPDIVICQTCERFLSKIPQDIL